MPTLANNGQQLSAGWDNTGGLTDFTSINGTDSKPFQPVNDRGGYSQGVKRDLTTGGTYYSGIPVVRITHSWISDGQIETLKTTYVGNCTLKHHITESVGKTDVQTSNVINGTDYNQVNGLERLADGYKNFVSTWAVVEIL